LLRGLTFDRYTGKGDLDGSSQYQWVRAPFEFADENGDEVIAGQRRPLGRGVRSKDDFTQQIILNPTGTNVLFGIGGILSFKPEQTMSIRYALRDQVLRSGDPLTQQIRYEVISSGKLAAGPMQFLRDRRTFGIDPKIEQFARRPEVSGSDAQGSLAERRGKDALVSSLDSLIAKNIETYLRDNFSYTLDLTDAARIEGQDPMVAFLYDLKRGHCEYFAGAMTLMCQSLGMQARMVVGFKCDEYNSIGNYFTVRESHAHAWVEVLDYQGIWQTFDPTSSNEAVAPPADTLGQKMRKLADFLQYSWATAVIAYDSENRANIIQTIDGTMVNAIVQGSDVSNRLRMWLSLEKYIISSSVIAVAIALMLLILFCAVVWFLFEQWRLRRRARRIGLDALPTDQQKQLAKQLGFYDELLLLLERRNIFRPPHLTPLEFSDSLTFLPTDAFNSIQRLTDAFYIVRFGHAQLSASQRRSLFDILANVESSLGAE
jgi:hypothetical protein